ncbi:hypothetical protein AN403_3092 [Pseudomonas fluorescens]|uniref:Uncharacterized protein n=1 Tax=Pseudomonas fluorescens TaxID=294 RepID=A0A0P8Z3E8_PSEFL|nr:hypothetical protein AN403_3092 [Pseudomonas fluorescens]
MISFSNDCLNIFNQFFGILDTSGFSELAASRREPRESAVYIKICAFLDNIQRVRRGAYSGHKPRNRSLRLYRERVRQIPYSGCTDMLQPKNAKGCG